MLYDDFGLSDIWPGRQRATSSFVFKTLIRLGISSEGLQRLSACSSDDERCRYRQSRADSGLHSGRAGGQGCRVQVASRGHEWWAIL